MCELLHMEPHGQHLGELEKGFARRYVEASSHDLDHVIMDLLEHVDEALRSIWFIRGVVEEGMHFFFGDQGEGLGKMGWRVIQEGYQYSSQILGKESIGKKVSHGVMIEVQVTMSVTERWDFVHPMPMVPGSYLPNVGHCDVVVCPGTLGEADSAFESFGSHIP